jgi:Fic family protein
MGSDSFLKQRVVTAFRGRQLPEPAWPVGYAQLIERYSLRVPLPPRLAAISVKYRKTETDRWLLLGSRSEIPDTLRAHLTVALKWEGVDLAVLAQLFRDVHPTELTELIVDQPKSAYGRRIWFLYEWVTGERLPIPDLGKATAVPVLDPSLQFALSGGDLSSRHKVTNNLPGTPDFCPLVRRSNVLESYDVEELRSDVGDVLGRTHPDVIQRAGDFLLLADSRASFKIEGERPSADRLQRWGYAIRDAGQTELSIDEILRLQLVIIGDTRFVKLGLRDEDGFIGAHDRQTRRPIPGHIDARPEDLPALVQGVIDYVDRAVQGGVDPIVVAAATAFGLVYIHPVEDGNGRIHRWLLHHVLAIGGLTPPGVVFPVSHVILERISEYREVLEGYSRQLLPLIAWEETEDHNVRVTNQTADYYRYFDATRHAEFLYLCVAETIRKNLPEEVAYLEAYDAFARDVQEIVDLPARSVELLVSFLSAADGTLSRERAKNDRFSALREEEVRSIEALYAATFGEGREVD